MKRALFKKQQHTNGHIGSNTRTDVEPETEFACIELFFRYCQQETFQPFRSCQNKRAIK